MRLPKAKLPAHRSVWRNETPPGERKLIRLLDDRFAYYVKFQAPDPTIAPDPRPTSHPVGGTSVQLFDLVQG